MGNDGKFSAKPEDTTPKKRAPRDPVGRKQAIINAAAAIISREGSGRITNRRVAEEAQVPLGSTTQYFKSVDELRRAGLAELARRLDEEYGKFFSIAEQKAWTSEKLADAISDYLSDAKRVRADAALCAAAIDDPEVRGIMRRTYDTFIERCATCMDPQRAKILYAFIEGIVIDSCFMGVPCDRETIRKAAELILGDGGS